MAPLRIFEKSPRNKTLGAWVCLVLLANCQTVERQTDVSGLTTSDFNGFWQGNINCIHHKGSYADISRHLEVTVQDGLGTLAHLGNWGNDTQAPIGEDGTVFWSGTYDNHEDNPRSPYHASGYWDGQNFLIRGRRNNHICNGVLTVNVDSIPGTKSRNLRVKTFDPGDYAPVISGGEPLRRHTVRGKIYYNGGQHKRPLVVLIPGFQGIGNSASFFATMPKKIADAGAAALIVRHKGSVDIPGRVVDIFMAVRKATEQDFIDPERVYVFGLSSGGMQALHMMMQPIHDALNDGSFKIAGMVLAYPNCRTKFENRSVHPIPTLMLVGGDDAEAPAENCRELIEELGGHGFMEYLEFPDAGHSWLFGRSKRSASWNSWAPCGRLTVHADGHWSALDGRFNSQELGYYEYIEATGKACARPIQVLNGRDQEAYDATVNAILSLID